MQYHLLCFLGTFSRKHIRLKTRHNKISNRWYPYKIVHLITMSAAISARYKQICISASLPTHDAIVRAQTLGFLQKRKFYQTIAPKKWTQTDFLIVRQFEEGSIAALNRNLASPHLPDDHVGGVPIMKKKITFPIPFKEIPLLKYMYLKGYGEVYNIN